MEKDLSFKEVTNEKKDRNPVGILSFFVCMCL